MSLPQRNDGSGTEGQSGSLPSSPTLGLVASDVPHLDRAVELLWQAGHPRVAEALSKEVKALSEKARRFESVLYPQTKQAARDRLADMAYEGVDCNYREMFPKGSRENP